MEKKKNKTLKYAVILYICLLALVGVSVFAWFLFNREAAIKTDDDNIVITAGTSNLEISLVGGENAEDWGSEVSLRGPEQYYLDITGDGNTLYYPTILDEHDEVYADKPETFKDVTDDSNYYVSVRLKMRTADKMNVYLAKNSYVSPSENIQGANLQRKSLSGDFSCDLIAAAARVGFYEPVDDGNGGENLILKCLWIPNDDMWLFHDSELGEYYVRTGSELSSRHNGFGYGYLAPNGDNSEYVMNYFDSEDYLSGRVLVGDSGLAQSVLQNDGETFTSTIGNAPSIISFEKSDTLAEKEMVIKVWFEGTDRESVSVLNGGQVRYLFDFVGVEKADNTTDISGIHLGNDGSLLFGDNSSCENKILFSTDGKSWENYGVNRTFYNEEIWVRAKESETQKPGDEIRKIQ